MRGKILWGSVGLAASCALVAATGLGLQWQAQRRLDQAIAALRAALPEGTATQIGSRRIGLFGRSVDLADIVLDSPGGSRVRIGSLHLDRPNPDFDTAVRFRRLEIRDIGLSDGGNGSAVDIASLRAESVDIPTAALKSEGGLAQAAIGAAEVTGALLAASDGVLEIGALTIGALRGGRLGEASLRGLHLTVPDEPDGQVDLDLGAVACTDIAAAALADGSTGVETAGFVDGCRLKDARLAAPQGKATLRSGRFAVTARDSVGRPIGGEGDLDGLTLQLPQFPELTAVLAKLGIAQLTLSAHAEGHGDPDARTVAFSESLSIDQGGDFTLDLALGNLPDRPMGMAAAVITLGPARLVWTDRGLIPAIEAVALGGPAGIGKAEGEIRDGLKALGVDETTGDWPAKLAAFLRRPGRIELDLTPVRAVQIGTLMDDTLPPAAKFGLLQPRLAVEAKP